VLHEMTHRLYVRDGDYVRGVAKVRRYFRANVSSGPVAW